MDNIVTTNGTSDASSPKPNLTGMDWLNACPVGERREYSSCGHTYVIDRRLHLVTPPSTPVGDVVVTYADNSVPVHDLVKRPIGSQPMPLPNIDVTF